MVSALLDHFSYHESLSVREGDFILSGLMKLMIRATKNGKMIKVKVAAPQP